MKAEIEMVRIRDGEALRKRDVVATEIPLTVFLNDVEVATLLTSDFECKSLAVGFLFAEGFLRGKEELSGLFESTERKVVRVYTEDKREPDTSKGMITAGCGGGGLTPITIWRRLRSSRWSIRWGFHRRKFLN
ncbi:MAG: formate dehydrogenase accessory sulfurtransferase FdhD [Candidatus Latescibacteria bacterium]|nr:formate dehydrogenase accessory sulfurtransferase FdhD [Candidatus Latescibacterota bacterium]